MRMEASRKTRLVERLVLSLLACALAIGLWQCYGVLLMEALHVA